MSINFFPCCHCIYYPLLLSCPVLSYPVLSCHIIFCHVLSCPLLSCHIMSCHILSCPLLSCSIMSRHVLSCPLLSCHIMSCHILSCALCNLFILVFFSFLFSFIEHYSFLHIHPLLSSSLFSLLVSTFHLSSLSNSSTFFLSILIIFYLIPVIASLNLLTRWTGRSTTRLCTDNNGVECCVAR